VCCIFRECWCHASAGAVVPSGFVMTPMLGDIHASPSSLKGPVACMSLTVCVLLSFCSTYWLRQRQVTPEQRTHAKRLAYGLLYGMGPSALAADLGVSMGQAVQLADDFRRSHPGLDAWIKVRRAICCWCCVVLVMFGNKSAKHGPGRAVWWLPPSH
jgi:hypothetical protein